MNILREIVLIDSLENIKIDVLTKGLLAAADEKVSIYIYIYMNMYVFIYIYLYKYINMNILNMNILREIVLIDSLENIKIDVLTKGLLAAADEKVYIYISISISIYLSIYIYKHTYFTRNSVN